MKKRLFISGILLVLFTVGAQNISLIPNAPQALASKVPAPIDLTQFAKFWVQMIATINARISLGVDLGIDDETPDVILADGIFAEEVHYCDVMFYVSGNSQTDKYQECRDAYFGKNDETPPFHVFMHTVYASPTLREVAYAWLKPVLNDTFSTVTTERKKVLCEIVTHGSTYVTSMINNSAVLNCEVNYLRAEEQQAKEHGQDGFSKFHWYRPNKDCNGPMEYSIDEPPYRKLEAWIVRRIMANHMSKEKIQALFSNIYKDVLFCNS